MLKTVPLHSRELYIEWSDVKGDSFKVFRSLSPQDEFEMIAEDITINHYVDKTVNFYNHALRYYYRIDGYINGEKVDESEVDTLRYQPKDTIADVVIYEARTALRVMKNPPVFVLIQRRDGGECPECWNPITKRVRWANCEVCNGTGIIKGGYFPPIKTMISTDISSQVDESGMLDGDEVTATPVNAWIANYPLVMPGDVIVDIMNHRYRINQVTPRTKSRYVMRQLLNLIPIERGDPIYQVEVDYDGE
jgi:hypothetical protein